jgi:two-component system, LytTR family, sensor kinase
MPVSRFLLVAAAFWSLFGLMAGIQVWISMLNHGHHVPWLLLYYQLLWLAWLAPTLLVRWLARRHPVLAPRRHTLAIHALAATLIATLHALYEIGLMLWMRPYDRMTATPDELEPGEIVVSRLLLGWILYCLVLGGVTAVEYYQRYHERALRAAQLERSLADARLHALQLQLQPHFVFNTLNAIAALVRTRQHDQATGMIAGLADLLRYSLDHEGRQQVALGEEIAVLRRYLDIEASRFPDRLRFRIDVPEALQRAAVPMLILQPLAENAVRHGIATLAAGGEIEVAATRRGERLQIRMRNDGALDPAAHEGIGLRNTRERLATLYGDAAQFSLSMQDGRVQALIALPYTEIA